MISFSKLKLIPKINTTADNKVLLKAWLNLIKPITQIRTKKAQTKICAFFMFNLFKV